MLVLQSSTTRPRSILLEFMVFAGLLFAFDVVVVESKQAKRPWPLQFNVNLKVDIPKSGHGGNQPQFYPKEMGKNVLLGPDSGDSAGYNGDSMNIMDHTDIWLEIPESIRDPRSEIIDPVTADHFFEQTWRPPYRLPIRVILQPPHYESKKISALQVRLYSKKDGVIYVTWTCRTGMVVKKCEYVDENKLVRFRIKWGNRDPIDVNPDSHWLSFEVEYSQGLWATCLNNTINKCELVDTYDVTIYANSSRDSKSEIQIPAGDSSKSEGHNLREVYVKDDVKLFIQDIQYSMPLKIFFRPSHIDYNHHSFIIRLFEKDGNLTASWTTSSGFVVRTCRFIDGVREPAIFLHIFWQTYTNKIAVEIAETSYYENKFVYCLNDTIENFMFVKSYYVDVICPYEPTLIQMKPEVMSDYAYKSVTGEEYKIYVTDIYNNTLK